MENSSDHSTEISSLVTRGITYQSSGIVRMKALSRRQIWWPGIDRAIEEVAKRCSACQRSSRNPGMVTLYPWVWPDTPFQRTHVDFSGPFLEKNFSMW